MKREEVLAKSRKENEGRSDERELQILANASQMGMAVGVFVAALIVLFSRLIDEPLLGLSAWAVYFFMYGSRYLYHFVETKERHRLVRALVGMAFGVVFFVGMIVLGLSK